MYKIRQIKYAVDSISIQVYKIENRKRIIVRHIGTARDKQVKSALLVLANDFSSLSPECNNCPRLSHQVWFDYEKIEVTDVATGNTVKWDRSANASY
jgi:hypothetical protein